MNKMNELMNKAKANKDDEFYTTYEDIELELNYYKDKLKGKTIYCNCDTPDSNFVKFLKSVQKQWGIKDVLHTSLDEGIDFRSNESKQILESCDIVISNPPFSLFREYLAQLIEYDKKFLIIGNVNAITYKDVFPLIKDNKIWLGVTIHSGDRKFYVPDDYPLTARGCGIDDRLRKYIRVNGVRWFTNLDYSKRYKILKLVKHYDEKSFPTYDNYNAIEVSRTADIPMDYYGEMGVPITFIDKWNPEQFEIIGISGNLAEPMYVEGKKRTGRFYVNNKRLYDRIIIRRR